LVRLEGMALHAGRAVAVELEAVRGPIEVEQNGRCARLSSLAIHRSDCGVTLSDGAGLSVDLVEHLLAALGGVGVRSGLRIRVEGPELPLLCGGASLWLDALLSLGISSCGSELVVSKQAELAVATSVYRFEPKSRVDLEVEIDFAHPGIGVARAAWDGTASSFARDLAPARTFGFARDLPALTASGRARAIAQGNGEALASMLVYDEASVVPTGRPPEPNEPARHKLLDLVGDLYLFGGPPLGRVFAQRPGHTATHEALRRALDQGIVTRSCV